MPAPHGQALWQSLRENKRRYRPCGALPLPAPGRRHGQRSADTARTGCAPSRIPRGRDKRQKARPAPETVAAGRRVLDITPAPVGSVVAPREPHSLSEQAWGAQDLNGASVLAVFAPKMQANEQAK